MARTFHHSKGDKSAIKKNKAKSKAFPRKEWREGTLRARKLRNESYKNELLHNMILKKLFPMKDKLFA
jgi:hypothetical protein